MIRIVRPDVVLPNLKRWGERQTALDCSAYDLSPADYDSGKAKFPKKDYYSKKPVKDLLMAIHHGKCCYCEKEYSERTLHVEHFRPKAGFKQRPTQKQDEWPGYYWLAYRWENLLLACPDCNSGFKGTFFPVARPRSRARSHHDVVQLAQERPLLIDPTREDPRIHIRFDGDTPKGFGRKGQTTIERIGLRRPFLREKRLELIAQIDFRYKFIKCAKKHPKDAELLALAIEARQYLDAAVLPEAEFSSMAIDYIANLKL